jgi:curved DNA-binding protein CbpA
MGHHEPVKPSIPDHYFDLGLATSATALDIRTAFRRLALLHHPDKKAPGDIVDAAEFRRIHDAYNVLRETSTRPAYDKSYSALRTQWINYRREYAEYLRRTEEERQCREREDGDRIRGRKRGSWMSGHGAHDKSANKQEYIYYGSWSRLKIKLVWLKSRKLGPDPQESQNRPARSNLEGLLNDYNSTQQTSSRAKKAEQQPRQHSPQSKHAPPRRTSKPPNLKESR